MTKLPSMHSMSGHHRHANEMPSKWRFTGTDDGIIVVFGHSLSSSTKKKKKKKNVVKVRPPLTKLSGSEHVV